jgi:PEP-CTERM motif
VELIQNQSEKDGISSSPSLAPSFVRRRSPDFGYWLSALDPGNQVSFYKGAVEVGALTPADVIAKLGTSGPYYGNPNPPFQGGDSGEPYAFINFYDMSGTFDQVVFTEDPAVGGYESDNHTVGFFTHVGGVPEPSTWAMMLLGFAGLGYAGYRASSKSDPVAKSTKVR